MSYETILYERAGRAIHVTLNRPEKRNALNDTMLDELSDALRRADEDAEACVLVLRGAGDKAFCAGADLGGFASADSFYGNYEARGKFPKLFMQLESLSKPSLAAVNGTCVAGGFGLMMACDLAIAKAGAKMGTPEIARGLFPYMISALIGRSVPRRRVFELMMLGELYTAEQMEAWDVINRAVPAEDFDAAVSAWVDKLASYSPAVLRLGRKALVQKEGMPLEGALSYLQGLLSVNVMMDDAAEGISAFFEKRAPEWKGK
jgi:enoyl-CoA hydratase